VLKKNITWPGGRLPDSNVGSDRIRSDKLSGLISLPFTAYIAPREGETTMSERREKIRTDISVIRE
jgi:hypothetical protein